MPITPAVPLTYSWYARLPDLLGLQHPITEDEPGTQIAITEEETHFIRNHQAAELQLQGILAELLRSRDCLCGAPIEVAGGRVHHVPEMGVAAGVRALQRAAHGIDVLTNHVRVLEQLRPVDFLDFRDALQPASGAESFQFRMMEAILGGAPPCGLAALGVLGRKARVAADAAGPGTERERVEGATADRIGAFREDLERRGTLRSWVLHWLYRTPLGGQQPWEAGAKSAAERFSTSWVDAWWGWRRTHPRAVESERDQLMGFLQGIDVSGDKQLLAAHQDAMTHLPPDDLDRVEDPVAWWARIRLALAFIETYDDLPLLALPRVLVDALVQLEANIKFWRDRHARLAERLIGNRPGTGGSAGVAHLDATRGITFFPEFIAVRTVLMPRRHRPEVDATAYLYAREVDPMDLMRRTA